MTIPEFLARGPSAAEIRGALWGEQIDPRGMSEADKAALRDAELRAQRDEAKRAKR